MDGNDPDTIHLTAKAGAIADATGFARRFARVHRLDDDAGAKLAIVVEELVTNLVEHGGMPGGRIDLRLVRGPGAVELALTDAGTHFDPRTAVASPIPPERGGGAGLTLVLAWTRVLDYRRENGINRLLLQLDL